MCVLFVILQYKTKHTNLSMGAFRCVLFVCVVLCFTPPTKPLGPKAIAKPRPNTTQTQPKPDHKPSEIQTSPWQPTAPNPTGKPQNQTGRRPRNHRIKPENHRIRQETTESNRKPQNQTGNHCHNKA